MEISLERTIEKVVEHNAKCMEEYHRSTVIIPERIPINDWLPANRILTNGASTGAYDPEYFPPVKQILEEAASGNYKRIVLKASVQSGKTEALMSLLMWSMSQEPADVIFLVPRDVDKRTILLGKIKPAILSTKGALKVCDNFVGNVHKTGQELAIKHNGGMSIRMRSSGTPMELASIGAKILIADEVDKYSESVRTSGDPVSLLQGRAINYYDSVLLMACSPTTDYDPETGQGSIIEHAYQDSNKCVWLCKCPHCGKYEHWNFHEHVRWDKDKPCRDFPKGRNRTETAHIKCGKCRARITEEERMTAVRAGKWKSLNPDNREARGFTWSRLIFPLGSLQSLALDWLSSEDSPARLQAFTNDSLAEVFRPGSAMNITPQRGSTNKEFTLLKNSPEIVYATVGVDVQDDRLEVVMLGFDKNNRMHVLEYRRIKGPTAEPYSHTDADNVWLQLTRYIHRAHKRDGAPDLLIQGCAIDTGHNGNRSFEFAAYERFNYNTVMVFCVKGEATKMGRKRPFIQKRKAMIYKRSRGIRATHRSSMAKKISAIEQYLLGVNQGKNDLAHLTKTNQITFCQQLPGEYFNQLQSETLVPMAPGSLDFIWKRIHGPNDALDATVYAYAVHMMLRLNKPIYAQEGLPGLRRALGWEVVD